MLRKKLKELLEKVTKEIKSAEEFVEKTKTSANEIAHAASASPSQSGDREHSRNQALINVQKLENLRKLQEELVKSLTSEVPLHADPPCYLRVELDGDEREFYLVNHPIHLDKITLVSAFSPLGQALKDKSLRETFEPVTPDASKKGRIVYIE